MKTKSWVLIGVFVVAALMIFANRGGESGSGELDAFATCLEESGATFYGAYWCPHCNTQKEMFGASADELPYVECSLPNRQGQTQACINAGIESYPTWEFPDGSRQTGALPLSTLAAKSGCSLPN